MAAEVSARNSSCGFPGPVEDDDRQRGVRARRTGRARPPPLENEPSTAPARIRGAVSPMAREPAPGPCRSGCPARRTAGPAGGRPASATRRRRNPPRGSRSGTARIASAEVMITSGRTSDRQRQAARQHVAPVADAEGREDRDEGGQSEQAVDDRRHAGEVADVDGDEPGEPVRRARTPRGRRRSGSRSGRPAARPSRHEQGGPDDALPDASPVGATGQRRCQDVASALEQDRQAALELIADEDREDPQREQEAEQQDAREHVARESTRLRLEGAASTGGGRRRLGSSTSPSTAAASGGRTRRRGG